VGFISFPLNYTTKIGSLIITTKSKAKKDAIMCKLCGMVFAICAAYSLACPYPYIAFPLVCLWSAFGRVRSFLLSRNGNTNRPNTNNPKHYQREAHLPPPIDQTKIHPPQNTPPPKNKTKS